MKKLYTTHNLRDLSFSRSYYWSSLFKVASLGTPVALFLSNAAPVFSANIGLTKASLESVKKAAVVYPKSSISACDDYNSGIDGYNSVTNVLTAYRGSAWEDTQHIFIAGGTVILDPEKYTAKGKGAAIDSMAHALGLGNIAIDSGYDNQDGIKEYTFANNYSPKVRADDKELLL
ncbi:hypothetical protein [Bartonella sp. OT172YNZD]|uniref:hypothetical protein n=1 Tax=Bartonella sp. OT172YNZD TaxID=3243572 RepID=UPI0035D04241